MDFEGFKMQNEPRWAWARTGALILFLVTGVLLVASLNSARGQQSPHFPTGAASQVDPN